jgi:Short C-terminal domain
VFGKHARLERELRQQGRAALATVLSARVRLPALTFRTRINLGAMRETKLGPSLWNMTVRVEPDDAPAFDAKIFAWLKDRPLWVVGVLYDPSDHRKVVVDRSVEARRAAEEASLLRVRALRPQASETVSPPASADDPLDRLSKLADLHERGVLTDAEFEAQKHKLLGQ